MQPNLNLNQLTARAMATDILIQNKNLAVNNTLSAAEAANPVVKQLFAQMSQDHLVMGSELFAAMERRGWYPIQPAQGVAGGPVWTS